MMKLSEETTKRSPVLIVVCGPTGVGKTAIAIQLARHFGSEIISADSRQLFKEINIGTATPSPKELNLVKHHLVNHISVAEEFNAGDFEKEALSILDELFRKNGVGILCGGSGLYIKALLEGLDDLPTVPSNEIEKLNQELERKGLSNLLQELQEKDPDYYNEVDQSNPHRIIRALSVIRTSGKSFSSLRLGKKKTRPFNTIKIGLTIPRQELYGRINLRVDGMIEQGLINEAIELARYRETIPLQTVGYQEVFRHLDGNLSKDEAIEEIKKNTRNYAKRQLTWFRKDSEITWFNPNEYALILSHINQHLK